MGHDEALTVVNRVIRSLARERDRIGETGRGGDSPADLAKGLSAWAADDAYEQEVLELSESRYFFDMKRCRYADM
jgi:hypothetical protein